MDVRSTSTGRSVEREVEDHYERLSIVTLPDGSMARYDEEGHMTHKKPAGGLSFQECYFPLKGYYEEEMVVKAADALRKREITQHELDEYDAVAERAKALMENTSYCVVQSHFIPMVNHPLLAAFGWEDWYVNLALCPKDIEYVSEKNLNENILPRIKAYFERVGPYIDVAYCTGDDMAGQDGPLISLTVYRKHIKRLHRKIFEEVRKYTDAKLLFHICGDATEFLSDLIDIGVEGINPVQIHSGKMRPEYIKREFGKDLLFWGGLDTQKVLSQGTPEQVSDEVRRVVDTLAKDGGLVFAPCHDIQTGTPVENIVAMLETFAQVRG